MNEDERKRIRCYEKSMNGSLKEGGNDMNIGVIGTGNMGRILIEALIDGNAVSPSQFSITNRTPEKAISIQKQFPGIKVSNINEIIQNSDLIFICVKPKDIHPILIKNKHLLTKDKCLISITSPISVQQLESVLSCSCARVIPSIINRALSGVTLCTFGDHCDEEWKKVITTMLSRISKPVEIKQDITRVASDIVSCGPAFFSFLTQQMIEDAVSITAIDHATATSLAAEMLIGMGELLKKNFYTLPSLQAKVCVKGGVTGEGINVLEKETKEMFKKVFIATHQKFKEDIEVVQKQFGI